MQYLKKEPFTIPANDGKIAQRDWDRAFLSAEDFRRKYGDKELQETEHNGN